MPRDRNIPQIAPEDQPLVEAIARMVNEEVDRRVGADAAFETRQRVRMEVMADGMWGAEHQDLVRLTEDAPTINIEGRPFRRLTQLSSKVYLGLWGTHSIAEPLYRDASVRAGPTVKPLDLRVGVIAGSLLPDAARVLGYLMAEGTSRQAFKTLSTMGMRPPSRAYIEDRVHRLASELVEHRDALHAVARDAEAMQELPVAAVSAGLDRFAVRMSELLPEDKAPPPRERRKPYKRTPPPPRELNWRMAWVGSVTLYDADGDALRTIRVSSDAATPRKSVVARIVAEVAAILDRHPGIPVVCIQDGAKDLRVLPDRLRALCAANSPFYPCVDFYHATSYLDAVVQACEPEGDPHNMRLWYRQRLLLDKRASYSIVAGLQRRLTALDERVDKEAYEATRRALTYLKPRRKLMRYAHLRALNLPIGSGATESTCALMQARVKQPGMSWETEGLRGVSVNSSSLTAGSSPGPLSPRTILAGSRLLDQDRIRARDDGNLIDDDGCNAECYRDRRVFVTKETFAVKELGNLDVTYLRCGQAAKNAGLSNPMRFRAWTSDGVDSPSTRFDHAGGRYVLVTGEVIAYGWDDLTDGELLHPIDRTADGTLMHEVGVWTGTKPDGTSYPDGHCDGWSNPSQEKVRHGANDLTDEQWTNYVSEFGAECGFTLHLYCFEARL